MFYFTRFLGFNLLSSYFGSLKLNYETHKFLAIGHTKNSFVRSLARQSKKWLFSRVFAIWKLARRKDCEMASKEDLLIKNHQRPSFHMTARNSSTYCPQQTHSNSLDSLSQSFRPAMCPIMRSALWSENFSLFSDYVYSKYQPFFRPQGYKFQTFSKYHLLIFYLRSPGPGLSKYIL